MEAAVPPPPPKLKPPGAVPAPPPPNEKPDVGAAPGAGAVVFGAPKLKDFPPQPVEPPPNENAIVNAFFATLYLKNLILMLHCHSKVEKEESDMKRDTEFSRGVFTL